MKVLMFGWEFPPFNSGGLGVACEGLVKALRRKAVDVLFVLPKRLDVKMDFIRFAAKEGEEDTNLAVNSILSPYLGSESYGEALSKTSGGVYGGDIFSEVWRYGERAERIAREEWFDLIHAHDWLSFPAGIRAKKVSGKPLIVHVHATEYDRTGGNQPNEGILQIEREGFREADLIVAVSEFIRKTLIEKFQVPAPKIKVCHNGIDRAAPIVSKLHAFQKAGKKIVLFVGRLTLQKGPDYFLQAAKLVAMQDPKAMFVVAGSGDMEYRSIEQAAALGLGSRVIFTGFLRGDELRRLYAMANVFVMPSVSEPFGLTALEAAQSGVPVIVSRQSGVKEVLTHVLLADFWDTKAFAAHILAVLKYPALKKVMSSFASQEADALTWDRAAESLSTHYAVLQ